MLHLFVCTPQGLELHLKNFKKWPRSVGLKITRHIIKSQIHLVRQSLSTKFPALQFSVLMEIEEDNVHIVDEGKKAGPVTKTKNIKVP